MRDKSQLVNTATDEELNDPAVLARKAGLTPYHARVLVALEEIARALSVDGAKKPTSSRKSDA